MTEGDDNPGRLTAGQQRLVEDNVKLIGWAMGYWPGLVEALGWDEAEGLAGLALCRAALHFRPERGKFSTFAAACILRRWLGALKRKRHECVGLDAARDVAAAGREERPYGDDELQALREAAAALPARHAAWYRLCITEGLGQAEAGRRLGKTRAALGSTRQEGIARLAEAMRRRRKLRG